MLIPVPSTQYGKDFKRRNNSLGEKSFPHHDAFFNTLAPNGLGPYRITGNDDPGPKFGNRRVCLQPSSETARIFTR